MDSSWRTADQSTLEQLTNISDGCASLFGEGSVTGTAKGTYPGDLRLGTYPGDPVGEVRVHARSSVRDETE
jgi:hypothetical protein